MYAFCLCTAPLASLTQVLCAAAVCALQQLATDPLRRSPRADAFAVPPPLLPQVRKYSESIDNGANMLVPVPGAGEGPGAHAVTALG